MGYISLRSMRPCVPGFVHINSVAMKQKFDLNFSCSGAATVCHILEIVLAYFLQWAPSYNLRIIYFSKIYMSMQLSFPVALLRGRLGGVAIVFYGK